MKTMNIKLIIQTTNTVYIHQLIKRFHYHKVNLNFTIFTRKFQIILSDAFLTKCVNSIDESPNKRTTIIN